MKKSSPRPSKKETKGKLKKENLKNISGGHDPSILRQNKPVDIDAIKKVLNDK